MRNQFFYTRKEQVNGPEGETTLKEYRDSFNTQKVIRSVLMSDKSLLVLLDDIHERVQETPNIDTRTNKVKGTIRKRDVFQTEISLFEEDIERFYKLTNIDV